MPFANGYESSTRYNLDSLGVLLIIVALTWTFLLSVGIAFLIVNRNLSFLRIRNLSLAVSAVAVLHIYWCLCLLAYVLNGNFPCDAEFWIMSIYLPLGIALYQANSTQLLSVAQSQQTFVKLDVKRVELRDANSNMRGIRKLMTVWMSLSSTKIAMLCISFGMIVQLICTTIVFMLSRRFHAGWGIVGQRVSQTECRKGWEWWPSIVWQFTWSWFYAPYVVWKVRHIDDTYAWRLQTIVCSIAGLPATPMWLIALYSPRFSTASRYWIPPMWFALSIAVMEVSVVLIPCWQLLKTKKLKKETLQIIEEWESKKKHHSQINRSIGSDSTRTARQSTTSHKASVISSTSSRRGEMYTMSALEKALETNPTPLLLFSALKDFSGENISFLTSVRDWKAKWNEPQVQQNLLRKAVLRQLDGEALRREQYAFAVEIYSSFVSLRYSRYPINLSSTHRKQQEALFDGAVSLFNRVLPEIKATPFNSHWPATKRVDIEAGDELSIDSTIVNKSTETMLIFPGKKASNDNDTYNLERTHPRLPAFVEIPDSFGPTSFNDAEASVKYMVLTNTWPKFVAAGYANTIEKKITTIQSARKAVSSWTNYYAEKWASSFAK